MAFWFFKKREDSKKDGVLHSKIENIEKGMQTSFSNVKKDITGVSQWIREIHKKHIEHHSKLEYHDKRFIEIEKKLEEILSLQKIKQTQPEVEPKEETIIGELTNEQILEALTTTDKRLFHMIYQLQKQLGGNPISFKSLANISYPSQQYPKIRSTISQYLNTLYRLGLIEKKRHGREAYIYLTDLGLSLVKQKIKQEREIRNKKKAKFT